MVDLNQFDPQTIVGVCTGLQIGVPLGQGGQKAVWRCTYQGHEFVLKVIAAEPDSRERARRELEVFRVCACRYLPAQGPLALSELDLGSGDSVLYYLEEFVEGATVSQVPKPLSVGAVVRLGFCVGEALATIWAHGYLHRDVKPQNIIQRINGDYVLLDAGIALDFSASSITAPGGVVGTPAYLSPDQLQIPKRDLDFRSDMFSLGTTMYECVTGQHPFWNADVPAGDVKINILRVNCPHPHRWNANLRDDICDLLLRLLEKERHLRYSRVEHFFDDLNRVTTI